MATLEIYCQVRMFLCRSSLGSMVLLKALTQPLNNHLVQVLRSHKSFFTSCKFRSVCFLSQSRHYLGIFLKINLFIYLFMALFGLCCHAQAFSSFGKRGLLFIAVRGLLIAVASLVVECRLQARGLQQLWHMGSVVVVHGLNCSVACRIFPDQGSNPCPLHWQADS